MDVTPTPDPGARLFEVVGFSCSLRRSSYNADALLIASPEYNHGVPGVCKHAIGWLSRPARGGCLDGKPAAIIRASPGMTGTARSQEQLRQVSTATNTHTLLLPEVLVAWAHHKFSAEGRHTDQTTRDFLPVFLRRFGYGSARFVTCWPLRV